MINKLQIYGLRGRVFVEGIFAASEVITQHVQQASIQSPPAPHNVKGYRLFYQ